MWEWGRVGPALRERFNTQIYTANQFTTSFLLLHQTTGHCRVPKPPTTQNFKFEEVKPGLRLWARVYKRLKIEARPKTQWSRKWGPGLAQLRIGACASLSKIHIMHTKPWKKTWLDNYGQRRMIVRTLVNVPIVMKVSFLFAPSPYKLFTASLIPAFRFASSMANPLTTARLAAAIDGLRLGAATGDTCFLVGGSASSFGESVFFLFLDLFLVDSSNLLRSNARRMFSSSSWEGLRRRISSMGLYFLAHCGQRLRGSWPCSSSKGFSFSLGEAEEVMVFSPAWEKTHPHVEI